MCRESRPGIFSPRICAYEGPYLFADPDGSTPDTAAQPFPYRPTEQVTFRHPTTASGRKPRTSPDPEFTSRVCMVEVN